MKKNTWMCCLAAVLFVSTAPASFGASSPAARQTSAKKKRIASAKSKKKTGPAVQKAPTADRIREIQTALQREGEFTGEPTGRWDDATVAAMKNYQDKNGLTATGKIDALTLHKLGLGSETAGIAAPVPATSSTKPASPALP